MHLLKTNFLVRTLVPSNDYAIAWRYTQKKMLLVHYLSKRAILSIVDGRNDLGIFDVQITFLRAKGVSKGFT